MNLEEARNALIILGIDRQLIENHYKLWVNSHGKNGSPECRFCAAKLFSLGGFSIEEAYVLMGVENESAQQADR